MPKVHLNFALHPENNKMPLCKIGAIGNAKDYSKQAVTLDKNLVTCKFCLGLIRKGQEKEKATKRASNTGK